MDITVSIVIYKTPPQKLRRLLESLNHTSLNINVSLIDNSPTNGLERFIKNSAVHYIHNGENKGYGSANNIILKRTLNIAKYHLVLNPDIYFNDSVIEKLYSYMEDHKDIGLIMPKVLYPDGTPQYLCKLIPRPYELIIRRFSPWGKLYEQINNRFELRFTGYDTVMDVPYLSGCFMFMRTEALREIGLFDERFFMYFEDTDLSRRMHKKYRTVYYPHVSIYHTYDKKSRNNLRLLWIHTGSAIKYFNKWGWLFDKERKDFNSKTLKNL